MNPKQKLIEAVKDLKIESLNKRIEAKNSNQIYYANGLVDQCDEFLKLIEEILPNEQ